MHELEGGVVVPAHGRQLYRIDTKSQPFHQRRHSLCYILSPLSISRVSHAKESTSAARRAAVARNSARSASSKWADLPP